LPHAGSTATRGAIYPLAGAAHRAEDSGVLTAELLRVKKTGGQILPRFLDAKTQARLVAPATELARVLTESVGTRRELVERALAGLDHAPKDRLVVAGLKKLLFDRCTFACGETVDPEALRADAFLRAAAARRELGPRDAFDRGAVLAASAAALGIEPTALEENLFADLRQNETLTAFEAIAPEALIARYDVALAQGVLLRATQVTVALDAEEPGRVRQLFRAARFHGLLHRVRTAGEGRFLIELDGPFSLFSAVQKYGLKLALFLPAVLRCRRWRLRAELCWGKSRERAWLELGPEHGLVPRDEAVSGVAPELARFVEGFKKLGSPWQVKESDEIIALPGEHACVPDLLFEHQGTGECVYLEAFGFWSRQAVWQRIETMGRGFPVRIILAIGKQLRVSEDALSGDEAAELYVYGASMRPKAVLERLERAAT
jgi:uncharacterized protein